MTADDPISDTAETTNHHYVIRDGSVWLCVHCKAEWPYPQPIAQLPAVPCVPGKWPD